MYSELRTGRKRKLALALQRAIERPQGYRTHTANVERNETKAPHSKGETVIAMKKHIIRLLQNNGVVVIRYHCHGSSR